MSDCASDPVDFILKEKWITVTAIGSIFTFAMVNKFRDCIFDPLAIYILPPESFDFMKVKLHDILPSPNVNLTGKDSENKGSYTLNFGLFFRETLIWLFMVIILYILYTLFSFPSIKGGSSGAAII